MNQENDLYYINEVLQGNVNAFSFLVQRYQDQAFGLAFKISGNSMDAEEIAQDAFMKAYKYLKDFKKKSKFSTWLYRIVYNTAITNQRSNRKHKNAVDMDNVNHHELNTTISAFDDLYQEEKINHLSKALEHLPDDERIIIHLYYNDDKSVKEIGEILSISEDNVKIKLFRIRKKLFTLLSKSLNNEIYDLYG